MKRLPTILAVIGAALLWAAPARALTTFFAEGPSSGVVGAETAIRVKARITEAINALKVTVTFPSDDVQFVRFDDSTSAVRLWLQRGVVTRDGVVLEGVIPGGIAPAFTDVVDIGTLIVRPASAGTVRIGFSGGEVFLNQPTPTADTVSIEPFALDVRASSDVPSAAVSMPVVTDADVRVVRESALNDGARTIVFDIKTDRGTVETVRIRERWLGLIGTWRDASTSTPLSDPWGASILDVSLPGDGGAHIASVIPLQLKLLWALFVALAAGVVIRSIRSRAR